MNQNLDDLKVAYEALEASENLKKRIDGLMKQEQQTKKASWVKPLKKVSIVAASLLLVCTVALNISPGLANAMSDIPILNNVVKMLTLSRYEAQENGYEANIAIPQIEGLLNKELEGKLNQQFKDNANGLIAAFEQDLKDLKAEFGDEEVHMGIQSDYLIKTDNEQILALDIYILNTAGSSSTTHSFYTIDKKTGQILTLAGLFQKDADYITTLSTYLKKEMLQLNKTQEGMFNVGDGMFEDFEKIKADQNFYINNRGNLVICFDKYEVAAGAQGSPEFIIPNELIAQILK